MGLESASKISSLFWVAYRPDKSPIVSAGVMAVRHFLEVKLKLRRKNLFFIFLLAEDELINREVGGKMLDDLGLQIAEAENRQHANKVPVAGDDFRLRMDMKKPLAGGIEATQDICALSSGYKCLLVP